MDKSTDIKIKYQDGTYSDEIPLSASAQNIDWDNDHSIVDIIGDVDFDTDGSIQTQIDNILAQKGAANGIATLNSNGQVPAAQLPSYVDDVLEYASRSSFPSIGESGKIYVDKATNLTYRWTGSTYVEISKSLALGITSETAYYGDKGKTAYDHSQTYSGNPHNVTKSEVGLGNVGNFKAVSTVASQGLTDTEKSNARTNIGAGTSSLILGTGSGNAYRGDYGNAAYTHAVTNKGSAFTSNMYKITTNSEGHVTAATAITKSDITGLGIPSSDTNTRKAFYGTCGTSASTQTKVVTLSTTTGWELAAGTVVAVKFTYTNTYNSTTSAPCKLNVNNTGAKNIYYGNTATPTGTNPLAFGRANCINQYVYDGTNWVWCGTSADAMVGQGYGIDSRSSATTAVTANLAGYILMDNGIVVIKFNYDVPTSATLNINGQGAKAIYYNDAPIINETIKAGYTATFIYNNYYRLIAIDRGSVGVAEDIVYDNTSTSLTSNNVQDAIDEIDEKMDNNVLYIKDIPVIEATSDTIVNYFDDRITPQHVLAEVVGASPEYITTDVAWSTETAGYITMSGTCTTETTVNVILVR